MEWLSAHDGVSVWSGFRRRVTPEDAELDLEHLARLN